MDVVAQRKRRKSVQEERERGELLFHEEWEGERVIEKQKRDESETERE